MLHVKKNAGHHEKPFLLVLILGVQITHVFEKLEENDYFGFRFKVS